MENAAEAQAEQVVVEEVKASEPEKGKKSRKPAEKLFPVKLLKNYRPISSDAQIQNEETGEYRALTEDEAQKVRVGQHIALPVQEARDVIASKIAERNDPVA